MIKVATAKEMQHIDRVTIEKYGIPGTVLMERAGLSVVKRINEIFFNDHPLSSLGSSRRLSGGMNGGCCIKKIIVLAGGGNNGGDGFVIARILHNQERDVEVFMTSMPGKLKGDAKVNYNAAKKFGVKITPVRKVASGFSFLRKRDCLVVDAILGTGLSKEVRSPLSGLIKKLNRSSLPVISVDIPSGISSDTGEIMGCAVKSEYTVTFGLPKRGHLLYPGAEYTGKLFVEEIGFARSLLESEKIRVTLALRKDMIPLLPKRPEYSHKGTYGHVLLIAGSKGKTGAALMAAKACLKTGAGLVTIGIPETLVSTFQSRVTEEMILPLPDKGNGTFSIKSGDVILGFLKKRANVLAVGPGLSNDDEISKLVCRLISELKVPIVIDADGLNAISGKTAVLRKSRAPVILTPHAGEMARLLKQGAGCRGQRAETNEKQSTPEDIEQDRIGTALLFAKKTKSYLILKGVPTVTATPGGQVFINSTGNPGMATAGTGDVLTGMISALLAQKLSPRDAALLGVYLHGYVGDIAAEKKGRHSMVASDIINAIPLVFKTLKQR
ncbi:MAG: NAD(P)H-hydrate dehydratase [Nitrospirota bacterium]